MADRDGNRLAKEYGLDKPASVGAFHVKGMEHAGWGMKDRLSKIFRPDTGKTVMLAFDHGYIMEATAGLERLDLAIEPLAGMADALMATRGGLRTSMGAVLFLRRDNPDISIILTIKDKEKRAVLW